MTRKKRIFNSIFVMFAIVAVMTIAVGGLFIAGIAVGAECALAEVSSLSVNVPYTLSSNVSITSQGSATTSVSCTGSVTFKFSNQFYTINIVGVVSRYEFAGYMLEGRFNSYFYCAIGLFDKNTLGTPQVFAYNQGYNWAVSDISITLTSLPDFTQAPFLETKILSITEATLPDSDTLSSGWYNNQLSQSGIDLSGITANDIYGYDWSSLDHFRFVLNNMAYDTPFGLFYRTTSQMTVSNVQYSVDSLVFSFGDDLGNATVMLTFVLVPAPDEYSQNMLFYWVEDPAQPDQPSDLSNWYIVPNSSVDFYISSSITAPGSYAGDILAFNIFASLWQSTNIRGTVSTAIDVDFANIVVGDDHTVSATIFSNSPPDLLHPFGYESWQYVELQYRLGTGDWTTVGYLDFDPERYVFIPTVYTVDGIHQTPISYQYRGVDRSNGVTTAYESSWTYIPSSYYSDNSGVNTWISYTLADAFYDAGYIAGHAYGYAQGETAPGGLYDLLFAVVETPFNILLGTWNSETAQYENGLLTFEIFGVNLRDFFLSLICLLFAIRIWGVFVSGSLPNLFGRVEHEGPITGKDSYTRTRTYNAKTGEQISQVAVEHHENYRRGKDD